MYAIRVSKPDINKSGYILSKEEISNVVGEIETMLDYGDINDKLLIEVVWISTEEFAELDEFTGW